jgi:hypothetical protein
MVPSLTSFLTKSIANDAYWCLLPGGANSCSCGDNHCAKEWALLLMIVSKNIKCSYLLFSFYSTLHFTQLSLPPASVPFQSCWGTLSPVCPLLYGRSLPPPSMGKPTFGGCTAPTLVLCMLDRLVVKQMGLQSSKRCMPLYCILDQLLFQPV